MIKGWLKTDWFAWLTLVGTILGIITAVVSIGGHLIRLSKRSSPSGDPSNQSTAVTNSPNATLSREREKELRLRAYQNYHNKVILTAFGAMMFFIIGGFAMLGGLFGAKDLHDNFGMGGLLLPKGVNRVPLGLEGVGMFLLGVYLGVKFLHLSDNHKRVGVCRCVRKPSLPMKSLID